MVYSLRLVAAGTTRLHKLVESGKLRRSAVDGGAPFVKRIGRGRAYTVEHSSLYTPLFLHRPCLLDHLRLVHNVGETVVAIDEIP